MEGPDKAVVDQLVKLGDELSKPREVEFFLYFPTEESIYEAAAKVRDLGFNVTVEPSGYDARWLCFATKRMVPDLEELLQIRKQFEALVAALDGEYDGWGTGVEL
ncbi:MAG: ribonuclease E inhibitor RraB [Bacteroidetes bacterium]|nr:ribonuclease E inhibitor RraB [Bacteroidota bacterium]